MNIVYALSGEGRGHASLARAVLPVLESAGHRLKVVTYGRSVPRLRDYDLIEIRGIRHCYSPSGRLSLARSLAGNAGIFPYYWSHWSRLRRQLADFSPDLFIVNFEPLTPLLARSLGVPVVSFDNQHGLVYARRQVPPGFRLSCMLTRSAARVVAAGADAYVVLSLAPESSPLPNVRFVPPVIQAAFRDLRPTEGGATVVYLKEVNPRFLDVLRGMAQRFIVFGTDRDATEGNLTFRAYCEDMPAAMASARAVIGTAGLSLISEALWLKKPFFGVPLKNEFEQTDNALWVREAGFGDFSENPVRADIEGFLGGLGRHRAALAGYSFDPDAAGRALLELADGRLRRPGRRAHWPQRRRAPVFARTAR